MSTQLDTAAHQRRRLAVWPAALLSALLALTVAPVGAAVAAEGPAPAPRSVTVLSDVHTDAISTFWDDGQLVLDTKADTPTRATRYNADDVWFHVDNDSRYDDFPAGYGFVAPAGSTVWLAPEVQQSNQIWPGFSTESVPSGVLDGNNITLTLAEVDGPGDVELWTSGSFGAVNRVWSSDESHKSFTRKNNVHMHANWAFTAAGIYRLTVRADAAVGGEPISATQVYTFVVGDLPEPVITTTDLQAATEVTSGDPLTLTSTVSPGAAEDLDGAVEFRDGDTVLGHDPVDEGGVAELEVTDLAVGTHDITATFVPDTTRLATGSDSAVVTVEVVDAVAEQTVALAPLSNHYHQGYPIDLTVVADPTLGEGDTVTWEWLWPGGEWNQLPGATGTSYELTAEQALDGVQVRASVDFAAEGVASMTTDPVTIHHDDHGAAPRQTPSVGGETEYVAGESLALGLELPENGQTVLTGHRWERRAAGSDEWTVVQGQSADELALEASADDDGASYRVSILKPTGEVAYGPSQPVTVSVAEEAATELGIAGVEASYRAGDVLRARVVGRELEADQTWRWVIRAVGGTTSYVFYGDGDNAEAAQGRIRQRLGADHDGYEIRARLRQGSTYVEGGDTPWVTIDVENGTDPVTASFPGGTHYVGESLEIPLDRQPLEGESVRLAYRAGSPWYEVSGGPTLDGDHLDWQVNLASSESYQFAWQTLRDGAVVAQSEPFTADLRYREVLVQGVRQVYRVGQTLEATAEIHPEAEGLTYVWAVQKFDYETYTWDRRELKVGTGPEGLELQLPIDLDLDEWLLRLDAYTDYGESGEMAVGGWSTDLTVSDAAPDEQLFFFESLSDHYHQGYDINLDLVADPALSEGDTVTWEWLWPGEGQEWTTLPGASGLSHLMTAEQALDGVQVRATLHEADTETTLSTDPVTIHHDDHGSAARQQPTVAGETSVADGDTVTLTRMLPENGPTVLTEHRWERRAADSDEWTVLEGETGEALSFEATAADDGASYRVSIVKPNGELGYGPSPAVDLTVEGEPEPRPDLGTLADDYVLELLDPVDDGVRSGALGINDAGDVVGITRPTASAQPQQTVLWERHGDHFHTHGLANLEGSAFSRGFDVNDDQEIVGEAFDAGGSSIPIRWEGDSAPQHVTTLNAAGTGILYDINDDGVAAATASGQAVTVAEDGTVTALPAPTLEGATVNNYSASSIADGDVVGGRTSLTVGSGSTLYGVVWDDEGARLLTTPEAGTSPTVSNVTPDGLAVGSATIASKQTAVLWAEGGTPFPLQLPDVGGYTHTSAAAMADDVVVGYVAQFAGNYSFGGAATGWDATGAVDLNSRVSDLPEGVTLQAAADVNDSGQIVGTATTPDGARGFVLTPVEEAEPVEVETEVSAEAVTQRYGRVALLDVSVSPRATGTVEVRVGKQTRTATLAAGRARVVVPAKSLAPGRRSVAITYRGVESEFAPSSGTATVRVTKARSRVAVDAVRKRVERSRIAVFRVAVHAGAADPAGRVTVRVAGRTRSVRLNRADRAVVKIRLPRSTRPGRARVVVGYGGSRFLAKDTARTAIRVTR